MSNLEIKEDGNLKVYIDNSSSDKVYFDNFEIERTEATVAVVVQENHYYPFGMNMKGIEELDLQSIEGDDEHRFQYNGKEKEESFGLHWNDHGARSLDVQLGRWNGVDALTEKYHETTPYNYTFNNPVRYVDPDGRDGKVTGSGTKEDPYVISANYYYVSGSLNESETKGLDAAIASYNDKGGKTGIKLKDKDGKKSYVKYNLQSVEVANIGDAKTKAAGDVFTDINGETQGFGNIVGVESEVTEGENGDRYGSATSSEVNINRENINNSVEEGMSLNNLTKGVYIHEIGHNLGGEHSDETSTMQQVGIVNTNNQIGGNTTSYDYPSLSENFTKIIFNRRDTRNLDGGLKPALYTEKKSK